MLAWRCSLLPPQLFRVCQVLHHRGGRRQEDLEQAGLRMSHRKRVLRGGPRFHMISRCRAGRQKKGQRDCFAIDLRSVWGQLSISCQLFHDSNVSNLCFVTSFLLAVKPPTSDVCIISASPAVTLPLKQIDSSLPCYPLTTFFDSCGSTGLI